MNAVSKILSVARGEIGTTEKGSNNVTYNDEYYGGPGHNYAWCVVFVWWVFKHADMSGLFCAGKKMNQCTKVMKYAKDSGCWVTKDYKAGDLLLFDWNGDGVPEHIGILEYDQEPGGFRLKTIEGNTTNEDKSKEGVFRKFRNVSNVLGAYRPSYPSDEEKPGAWARDACEWAMDRGIIRGYGNGVYGWGSYITREEMAVMLRRFYELDKE